MRTQTSVSPFEPLLAPPNQTSVLMPPPTHVLHLNRSRAERAVSPLLSKRAVSPREISAAAALNARRGKVSIAHATSVKILTDLAAARRARVSRISAIRAQAAAAGRRDAALSARNCRHRGPATSPVHFTVVPPPIALVSTTARAAGSRLAVKKLSGAATRALAAVAALAETPPASWGDFTLLLDTANLVAAARLVVAASNAARGILIEAQVVKLIPTKPLLPGRVLLAAFAIAYSPSDALSVEPNDLSDSNFPPIYGFSAPPRPRRLNFDAASDARGAAVVAAAVALVAATLALGASARNLEPPPPPFADNDAGANGAAIVPRDTRNPPIALCLDASPIVTPRLRAALNGGEKEAPARCVHALGAFFYAADSFSRVFLLWKAGAARALVAPLRDTLRALTLRRAELAVEAAASGAGEDAGLLQLRAGVDEHLVRVRSAAVRALGGERSAAAKAWLASAAVATTSTVTVTNANTSATLPAAHPRGPPARSPPSPPLRPLEPRAHVPNLLSHITRNHDLIHALCVDTAFAIPLPQPPPTLDYLGLNEGTSPAVAAATASAAALSQFATGDGSGGGESSVEPAYWLTLLTTEGPSVATKAILDVLQAIAPASRIAVLCAAADDVAACRGGAGEWRDIFSLIAIEVVGLGAPARAPRATAHFASLNTRSGGGVGQEGSLWLSSIAFLIKVVRVDAANALINSLRPSLIRDGPNLEAARLMSLKNTYAALEAAQQGLPLLLPNPPLTQISLIRDAVVAIAASSHAATVNTSLPEIFKMDARALETAQNCLQSMAVAAAVGVLVATAAAATGGGGSGGGVSEIIIADADTGALQAGAASSRRDAERLVLAWLDDDGLRLAHLSDGAIELANGLRRARGALPLANRASASLAGAVVRAVDVNAPLFVSLIARGADALCAGISEVLLARLGGVTADTSDIRVWRDVATRAASAAARLPASARPRIDATARSLADIVWHADRVLTQAILRGI